MSDPVTNMEIEDVLSSIRRLVAEGDKVKQEKKQEYGTVPAEQEKFVLTPALRIAEESLEADDEAFEESDETMDLEAPVGFAFTTSEKANELEEQSASLKEVFVGEPHAVPLVEEDQPALVEAPEELVEVESQETVESSRESLEATIAALEAAVTGSTDEFEPDGSEVVPTQSWGDDEDVVFDSIRNDPSEETKVLELTPQQEVSPEVDHDPKSYGGGGATDAETFVLRSSEETVTESQNSGVDGAVSESATKTEPDGRIFRVVPDHPPEPAEQEHVVEEMTEAPQAAAMYHRTEAVEEEDYGDEMIGDEPEVPETDDELDKLLADGSLLDEALLKEIVAEVVKGELQGRLGETITRNVRRLVRREINRVLTHQELE